MDKKICTSIVIFSFIVFGGYFLFVEKGVQVKTHAEYILFPGVYQVLETEEHKEWKQTSYKHLIPLYQYWSSNIQTATNTEDDITYEMILAMQEKEEEHVSEDLNQELVTTTPSNINLSVEKLRNFNYLVNHFYTVDSSTIVKNEDLNIDQLLGKNMKVNLESDGPKVLIYHTHSQESFIDSIPGDANTSIVGMGAYLSELLNAKGITTLHHNGVYDIINGRLDRSEAYQMAEKSITQLLKQYPSIEVVIDLHRDGVPENTHLVTNVNGKQTAKIMFFNGLSRTKSNGDIGYLKNPYLQDNLAFSLQMKLKCEELYPGFARRIYLRGYRYNLHLKPKSLLIEAGAQTNTVQEMKNAMELLANVLHKVLL